MSTQTQAKGIITSVTGQIATVEIEEDNFPDLFEILVSPEDPQVILEVFSQSRTTVSAVILSSPDRLFRGMKVTGTGSDLKVPVGQSVLGRVLDLFGSPKDNAGTISNSVKTSIYSKAPSLKYYRMYGLLQPRTARNSSFSPEQ